MPIPSIRPNLAGLVEKDMTSPAKSEIAPPPPKASEETPTAELPMAELPMAELPMAETHRVAEKAAPATKPAQSPKATPRPQSAAPSRATSTRERKGGKPMPVKAGAKAPPAQKPVLQIADEGWSYSGDTGPDHWGGLRPEWKLCSEGKRQSPINLQNGVAVDLEPVKFDYRPTRFRITDTGKMLRVNVDVGMSVEVRGKRYELEYVTLHRPSQERVGGGASDMVVHFHHRSADGELANVGVLMERGEQDNPMLQVLLNNLPLEKGSTYMPDLTIDLAAFMPTRPEHYLYLGSLTTPPCTEGVLWVVMKQSGELSQNQLDIFNRLYPRNSRPIQPTNGRLVLESR
ncbi:carbonic anhydrase family protein [Azoarcus sp. L1K30]|nr:carbonic anhydrase family protein [Azoarcus sp. L1K30]